MDEASLVRQSQSGDVAAFETLYRHYGPRVFRTAYLIIGERQAAEEVMQDAFVQTYRMLGQLREPQAFSSWLYRSAIRLAQKRGMRDQSKRLQELRYGAQQPMVSESSEDRTAVKQLVWETVQQLPEQHRIAVYLHYYQDKPIDEISLIMEAPVGTVKSWLHRAKAMLANLLQQEKPSVGGI